MLLPILKMIQTPRRIQTPRMTQTPRMIQTLERMKRKMKTQRIKKIGLPFPILKMMRVTRIGRS